MHAYADDVQLYLSANFENVDELCFKFNNDLASISSWALRNDLRLNSEKSYVLPISKKHNNSDVPQLFIAGSCLKFVSKVSNLGFIINSSLSCDDHVNSVVCKVYSILRNLRMTAAYTPVDVRKTCVTINDTDHMLSRSCLQQIEFSICP